MTNDDVTAFVAKLQAFMDEHYHPLQSPLIEATFGKKYARIIRDNGGNSRSAYAFVDLTNGGIFMAAGWSVPAKHARGNIFAENPLACCGPYGVAYLR